MGLDYIRSATGKPWRKRWAGGLDRLKRPTLFDLPIRNDAKTVTASLTSGVCAQVGASFLLQLIDERLVLFDGLRIVGSVDDLPNDLKRVVADSCGVSSGIVERVGVFGDTVEVSLQ
jgi:hypothetical protein